MYERLQGNDPIESIVRELPDLTAEQVQAAVNYWRAHPNQIQLEIDADQDALAELAKTGGTLALPRSTV
jgi:hypothetical protein